MMLRDDREVWALASAVIRKYGEDALTEAQNRAQEALDAGDMDGHTIWRDVMEAIAELARSPIRGEKVH